MKRFLNILFVLFILNTCIGQATIVDSLPTVFKKEHAGDEIRESFDNYEKAIPTRKPDHNQKFNHITLTLFHSKNLYVNTVFNKVANMPELANFKFRPPTGGYAVSAGAYISVGAIPLFDSVPVVAFAYGVNEKNKDLYQFRVLKNKNEVLIPWKMVTQFRPVYTYYRYNVDGSEQKEMGYLGSFSVPVGNSITIEVRNINVSDTIYDISAVWVKRAPGIVATITPSQLKNLITIYKYQWKYDQSEPGGATYYGDIKLKPIDSLLKKEHAFKSEDDNLFFYLRDKVKSADLVEYNLLESGDSSGWRRNNFDPNIISLKNLQPGEYKLLLRYAFQRQTIKSYDFTIKPAWYQTLWFKILATLLPLLALASIYLLIKNRRQKQKTKQETLQKEITQAEIKSIKSQFNPHFVFNALSSIQGLITKNDTEAAYKYLSDFSMLLRNSLSQSEKEYISLSKDIELIANYIKLEQLRFGFQFLIEVDVALNRDAVEVPALLLQPVVENAIKHGISKLYGDGCLTIVYTANNTDLMVSVQDNGAGFTLENRPGYGLKLTGDRIRLLNQSFKGQRVDWRTNSTKEGTIILFTFKNWLA